jgi:hypothetical protein
MASLSVYYGGRSNKFISDPNSLQLIEERSTHPQH